MSTNEPVSNFGAMPADSAIKVGHEAASTTPPAAPAPEVLKLAEETYAKWWETQDPAPLPEVFAAAIHAHTAAKDAAHKKEIAALHKAFGCELRDPNGTIWEYASSLEACLTTLEAAAEQARGALDKLVGAETDEEIEEAIEDNNGYYPVGTVGAPVAREARAALSALTEALKPKEKKP